jgi:NitT/TauT family transport system substrate-binding protein
MDARLMNRKGGWVWVLMLVALLLMVLPVLQAQQKPLIVLVGYFPNITHAQALVGRAGWQFEKSLGPGVQIEWKAFNAGPSAIEALFANAIDMTYVGPNPTVTGYVRSQGAAVRVIAGAASGGASLVVRQAAGIQKASDFHGKKIATPQQGNSQDVALRSWLRDNGLKPREKGGDVQVLPITNADQFTLFLKGQLDAAWLPNPGLRASCMKPAGEFFWTSATFGRIANLSSLTSSSPRNFLRNIPTW